MESKALLVLLLVSSASTQSVHYVKPNDTSHMYCPKPCLTLSQYTNQSEKYFTNGANFMFLPGNHSLLTKVSLTNVSNITFQGLDASKVTILLCRDEIVCQNVSDMMVFRLIFLLLNPFRGSSALTVIDSTNVFIDCICFRGHSDDKISARALQVKYSTMNISNCFFESLDTREDGGAIFAQSSTLFLSRSAFIGNTADRRGGAIFSQGSDIVIMDGNLFEGSSQGAISSEGSSININCLQSLDTSFSWYITAAGVAKFSTNGAENGGAISFNCTLSFSGSAVIFNNNTAKIGGALQSNNSQILTTEEKDEGLIFVSNKAIDYGGALSLEFDSQVSISAKFVNNTAGRCGGVVDISGRNEVTFKNIFATGNNGSAFCLSGNVHFNGSTNISGNTGSLGIVHIHPQSKVSFTGSTVFDGNEAESGGAIYAFYETVIAFFNYTSFSNNIAHNNGGAIASHSRLIFDNVTRFSCNTAYANGGAIFASGANITFKENSSIGFTFNSAINGGAMYLSGMSSLTIKEKTFLNTSHNNASEFGGVIYQEDFTTDTQCYYLSREKLPLCLIRFALHKHHGSIKINADVKSHNNSAGIDGSFLFGGLLDRCWMPGHKYHERVIPLDDLPEIERSASVHKIASQPYKLCFWDGYECKGTMNTTVYRGQNFTVKLRAIDQLSQSISTRVTAMVKGGSWFELPQSSESQKLSPECSNLTYSIYSTESSTELILYPEGPCRDTGLARAIVNVTLLPCPRGFNYTSDRCLCEDRLQVHGAICTINEDAFITRGLDSRLWMKALYENDTYQGLILYHTCPLEYCAMEILPIDLDNPDMQCANNRSGVVCGACAADYSLMLGSSRCEKCSNTYLALLLPFAAAGITLVIFLSILRLTVANGMINSVILYANIIQANKEIFLPNTFTVLKVFVAWMNLDLGLETCFYDGLTAYAETWLQFAFPIYVWMLISAIILTSKYSLTVSKLIGHNPIAVLATLLLMSYTKMLKIIIDVYRLVKLDYPEGVKVTRWFKDANIDYLHSKHLVLSVVTSLVLVFVFLPYTFLLLLGYKLYHFSDKRLFRWLNRFKPLLDSYYAPYNKHTRYWTGFLLLVRCALYGTFLFGQPKKSLLAIVMATMVTLTAACLIQGKTYIKCCNDIIEKMILLNLVTLAAVKLANFSSSVLVHSLIGMVFSIMVGIIFYRFCNLIVKSTIVRRIKSRYSQRLQVAEQVQKNETKVVSSTTVELCEPLINDD